MTFAFPLGLLALLGIPLIVALHLFRRRFQPRPVSALFLWNVTADHAGGGRTRQPLRNRASLWWELLACVALALALAQPRLTTLDPARHVMLIADTRWAMAARHDGTTSWVAARAEADALLAGLRAQDRVTVIATGRVPRLLAGPATDATSAIQALAALVPDQPAHDADAALALAASLGGPNADIVLLSDHVPAHPPHNLGWIATGAAVPTSGLADAAWLDDRQGQRLVARISASGAAVERPWHLMQDNTVLMQGRLTVAPGQPALLTIPATAIPGDVVTLRLLGDDALPQDDACVLRRPPSRALTARVDLPEGATRTAVLAALHAVGSVAIDPAATSPHLRITDQGRMDGGWSLHLRPQDDSPMQLGPFLARSGHPLLDGVDTTGLLWAGSATTAADDDLPLLTAAGRVLLTERRDGDLRHYRLSLDPTRAKLFQHPAWPVLIANLCALRRAALPGPERTTLHLDEPLAVRVPPSTRWDLIAPDGVTVTLTADIDGRIAIPGCDRTGPWRLHNGATTWTVEVNALDAGMADLSHAQRDRHDATPGQGATANEEQPLLRLIPILVALIAAVAAIAAYRREE
jgi:hypothetical protein